jgi:hypothetical protein
MIMRATSALIWIRMRSVCAPAAFFVRSVTPKTSCAHEGTAASATVSRPSERARVLWREICAARCIHHTF